MSYEKKVNEGALFRNDEMREGKKDANARGEALVQCPHCGEGASFWIKAWTNVTDKGMRWQKLKFDAKEAKKREQAPPPAEDISDDIPF